MRKHFDFWSILVIALTLILFIAALIIKGLTHDLLLEAGVFLVSVKLILMSHRTVFWRLKLKIVWSRFMLCSAICKRNLSHNQPLNLLFLWRPQMTKRPPQKAIVDDFQPAAQQQRRGKRHLLHKDSCHC